ncbi:hypothetical protein HN385_00435 [archaeon]|jgi:hypothetical protein|nr:hypothetical protein [archaeon]MBT6869630.1 hypothetical protein [archaeon]
MILLLSYVITYNSYRSSEHKVHLEKYCGTSFEFEEAYLKVHDGFKYDILGQYEIGVFE